MLGVYWKRYRVLFLTSVFFVGCEALCSLLQPTIVSRVVDVGIKNNDLTYVVRAGAAMLGVTVLGALMATGRNIISGVVSQKFGRDLRLDLYKKIQYLNITSVDSFSRASLITRLTNDVTQIQNFANGLMRVYVKAPVICIGCLVMAIMLSLRLSVSLAVILPVIALLIFINIKVGYPLFKKVQQSIDGLSAGMREYLSGIRVVKAFNRFDYESDRFKQKNDALYESSVSAMRVMAVFTPALSLVVNSGIVAVIWFGGDMVFKSDLEVGKIIAFVNYLTQLIIYLNIISNVFNQLIRAFTSYERIKEVMAPDNNKEPYTRSAGEEAAAAAENLKTAPRLEFKAVTFFYNASGELPAVRDICFTCEKGETVGIIGATGAGKSTLLSLLLRFYRLDSNPQNNGGIFYDGVNILDIPVKDLRGKIAWGPQESRLFTGTIKENIRWGKKDAGEEECLAAAKAACAHEFIEAFTDGYDTRVGQNGVNLSGGQKQRVSIARALIKKPEVLILDDCTSAVDYNTEYRLRTNLKTYMKDLTCIVIAQRISSVMGADKIIVLDKGEISAIGTHEELLTTSAIYREIVESQMDAI